MLNGFEDITKPITETEKKLLTLFMHGLSTKIGESRAITSNEMKKALMKHGVVIDESRIRKIINYIRCHNLIKNLVATSKGYYVENDKIKLKKYVDSLKQRAEAILAVVESYKL